MITVEELVIQSSRHKLTLINVKRAGGRTPTGGMMDGLGLLITGAQRMRAAMAAQNRLTEDQPSTSASGQDGSVNENSPSTSREVQTISSPGHMSPTSPVQTLLDTGEFQLVKQLAKSMDVEVLDEGGLPPVWLFNPIPIATPPRSPSSSNLSPSQEVAPRMSGEVMARPQLQAPARIDLSRYDHFSIVHYQDLTDPNLKSMVMIQTPRNQGLEQGELESAELSEYLGYQPRSVIEEGGADNNQQTSLVPRSVYPENMEVESQLIAMDEGHQPDDVVSILTRAIPAGQDLEMDSGIFDMVQGRQSQSSTLEGELSFENSIATCGAAEAGYIASASTSPEPYVPDTEPMLSYKVYQINHEIVLSSSGDEGQQPRIETVTERKALPLSSSTQQPPPRRRPKRTSSTKGRGRGKRRTKVRGRRKAAAQTSDVDDSRSGYTSTPETGASSPYGHSPVVEDKIDLATSMLEGASLQQQDLSRSFTEKYLPPGQNARQTSANSQRWSSPPLGSYDPQQNSHEGGREMRGEQDGYSQPGRPYDDRYMQERFHGQDRHSQNQFQHGRYQANRIEQERVRQDRTGHLSPENWGEGARYRHHPSERMQRSHDQYLHSGRQPSDYNSQSRRSSRSSAHYDSYPGEQNGYVDSSDDYSAHNTSRIETTFSEVDDTITCGEDETAFQPPDSLFSSFVSKVVPKPLQKPLRSGVNQGLNLFNRDKKSTAPRPTSVSSGGKNILNRCAMNNDTEDELATPSSATDLLFSPSSEDSNHTMHTAYSQASWDTSFVNWRSSTPQAPREENRENPTGAPRTTIGEPRGPLMSSYRGPFLSVPLNKSQDLSGDSDDPTEYESAEDRSLSPVSPAPEEMPVFVSHANWMSELPKRLHMVPLSGLAIPGSNIALAVEHDMRIDMSFSKCNLEMAEFLRKLPPLAVFNNFRHLMKDIWRSWMAKQLLSISQQLDAGVRYLDIRITKFRGALYGEHGLFTRQLKQYMREVDEFLVAHPKEVVIIHFQSFENVDHRDKRALVTTLFQIFGAKLSRTGQINKLTLETMWKSRKQLVVIFPDSDIEDLKNHIFSGLLWSNKVIRCSLPKKTKAMDLARYLDCIYDENRDDDMLHVIQAVLSPDMRMVFGDYKYKSMRELTIMETNPVVKHWMLDKRNLNIVAIDFVGCYDVTGGIIALNELKKAETFV